MIDATTGEGAMLATIIAAAEEAEEMGSDTVGGRSEVVEDWPEAFGGRP